MKITLFTPRKEKIKNHEPSAYPPEYGFLCENGSKKKQTHCLGGRHMISTYDVVEYEKVNPKTIKIVSRKRKK